MCDSVEHRVHCFQLANERRKQGKDPWAYRVDLKSITERHSGTTPTDAQLAQVCNDIAKALKAKLPATFFDLHHEDADMNFIDIIEALEAASVADFASDRDNGVKPVDLVNGWLSELYDWCDVNRVWTSG